MSDTEGSDHVGISVRQARTSDAGELARLRWDFRPAAQEAQEFGDFAAAFEQWLNGALAPGGWTVAVADDGAGRLVGCLFLECVAKVPDPGAIDRAWGYVTNFYVAPTHRGKGVGGRLLDAVIEVARTRTLELLIVWPSEEAAPLYGRAGFRHVVEAHDGPDDYPPLELLLS